MLQTSTNFKQFPIFQKLTEDDLLRLQEISIERIYTEGTTLFRQAEPRKTIYFILSGFIKVYKVDAEGQELVTNILHANEMFPHFGFFEQSPYTETAVTLTDVHLLAVPIKEFELLLLEKPGMAIQTMQIMEEKFLEIQEQLQFMQTQDVFHRVVLMLVRFATELGERKDERQIFFILPITNLEFANMIGVSRETVNRVFNHLKKIEIMSYNRKQILIKDFPSLQSYLGD
ncbi:Crp/Fnr family transcriptional regulator [Gracilibacillus sp. S3-1-1]|uniref:Crp/Fnr family transcriptional regulator n=1 Tax=Gracilibacillus pellucidus TaxID=3095368 RepID=A0ACC6M4J4_9BACI|nr:Crp/Fnr family transcriptional regulator [Gracilibacillus sp. S3-1-1]MDX8045836.1 Crp/Fnr family transcriptional regulator [Gracilibacillus sp. S3-1-1]